MTTPDSPEGRFVLVTGSGAADVGQALVRRLPRAASVDGPTVAGMFADGAASEMEGVFLRYTAGIALADSFRFAGFDAVVVDEVPAEHLEAYLDFASPTPVHLVRIGADEGTPGLRLEPGDADALAEEILTRLEEARLETEPAEDGDES